MALVKPLDQHINHKSHTHTRDRRRKRIPNDNNCNCEPRINNSESHINSCSFCLIYFHPSVWMSVFVSVWNEKRMLRCWCPSPIEHSIETGIFRNRWNWISHTTILFCCSQTHKSTERKREHRKRKDYKKWHRQLSQFDIWFNATDKIESATFCIRFYKTSQFLTITSMCFFVFCSLSLSFYHLVQMANTTK